MLVEMKKARGRRQNQESTGFWGFIHKACLHFQSCPPVDLATLAIYPQPSICDTLCVHRGRDLFKAGDIRSRDKIVAEAVIICRSAGIPEDIDHDFL